MGWSDAYDEEEPDEEANRRERRRDGERHRGRGRLTGRYAILLRLRRPAGCRGRDEAAIGEAGRYADGRGGFGDEPGGEDPPKS